MDLGVKGGIGTYDAKNPSSFSHLRVFKNLSAMLPPDVSESRRSTWTGDHLHHDKIRLLCQDFFRFILAIPINPKPKSRIVAGSGTGSKVGSDTGIIDAKLYTPKLYSTPHDRH